MLRTLPLLGASVLASLALSGSALAAWPVHAAPTTPSFAPISDTIYAPLPTTQLTLSWSPSTFDPSIPAVYRRYHVRVDATPQPPYAPTSDTTVVSGLVTSWRIPVHLGVHYDVLVRGSQCWYEYGMCVWAQGDWAWEHFDVALAVPFDPPVKG